MNWAWLSLIWEEFKELLFVNVQNLTKNVINLNNTYFFTTHVIEVKLLINESRSWVKIGFKSHGRWHNIDLATFSASHTLWCRQWIVKAPDFFCQWPVWLMLVYICRLTVVNYCTSLCRLFQSEASVRLMTKKTKKTSFCKLV